MDRLWIALGGLFGLLAVATAAAAAHLPGWSAPPLRDAIQMLGWHALALLATGLWARRGRLLAQLAGLAFSLGTPLFVGSVFALQLRGLHPGALAPTGGMLLMAGWALLALSALRAR